MTIGTRTATVAESASATSISGTLPSGTTTGDVTVALFVLGGSAAQFTGPSGWTQLVAPVAIASNTETMAVYYRVSPPSAPSASTSGAAGRCTCIVQSYTAVDTTTPVDVAASSTNNGSSTSVVEAGVTTVTAGARVIGGMFGDTASRTVTIPAALTLDAAYAASSTGRMAALASVNQGSAGATGTLTWTWSPSATVTAVAWTAALRPAGQSFTGTAAVTAGASGGTLTTGITGTAAVAAGASGGALNLGVTLGGTGSATASASGSLTTISRVFTGTLEAEFTPGVWTDITSRLALSRQALTIRQGRATEFDEIGAGALSCVLFNDDGALMPENPSSPYAPNWVEGIRIRWKVTKAGATYTRFVGWISEIIPDFPSGSTTGATVAVVAVDALGALAQRRMRSNWIEMALWRGRTSSIGVDAFEVTGVGGGGVALTNYSEDVTQSTGSQLILDGEAELSVSSDQRLSTSSTLSFSPGSSTLSSTVIITFRSNPKYLVWWAYIPDTAQASSGNDRPIVQMRVAGNQYFWVALHLNGSAQDLVIVNSDLSVMGTIAADVAHEQWVMVSLKVNTANNAQTEARATFKSGASTSVVVAKDLRTVNEAWFPNGGSNAARCSMSAPIVFTGDYTMSYLDGLAPAAAGTLATRLTSFQRAVDRLPVSFTSVGSLSTPVHTGKWDRYALDVLQEMMRSNNGIAWARSRDSQVMLVDAASCRPASPIATVDIDADCAGPPRLARTAGTRPTRIQVDTPSQSVVVIDSAAEAGPGRPQRSRTVSTVNASTADARAVGNSLLAKSVSLRIVQLVIDLTTGVTDHTAALFGESGSLTGLFPTCRVRTPLPSSYFGVSSRDHYVQGWTETYSPQGVRVSLDTTPAP